ncbi:MAG: membrane protein insertion efficiency factor YidD [Clostridia bacterium]|nr:membrane protein insertion efficiency factor YidD [Clostridia bacterium]
MKLNKLLSKPLVIPIRLYQKFISSGRPASCRFTPTCSSYAIGALEEWGPVVGLVLAVWRVLRCNPFSKGGYDPVPLRKKHRTAENPAKQESAVDAQDGDTPSDK